VFSTDFVGRVVFVPTCPSRPRRKKNYHERKMKCWSIGDYRYSLARDKRRASWVVNAPYCLASMVARAV